MCWYLKFRIIVLVNIKLQGLSKILHKITYKEFKIDIFYWVYLMFYFCVWSSIIMLVKLTLQFAFFMDIADYMLGGEFQCDDFVPQVRIEETEPVEMYNIPEHQKHLYLSEMDSIVEKQIQDLQVEDLSMAVTHSSTVDVVKEPIKHTYASIVCVKFQNITFLIILQNLF